MTTEDPTESRPSGAPDVAPAGTARDAGASTPFGAPAPTQALHVPTRALVLAGIAVWALALVVTLVVPSLHAGERSWWPWTCVAGVALGAFALWYVTRRGRSDAAGL